ncbi:hypothetical protein Q75_02945 [Bacillus coahuilensis p1.1.43]|uniref:Uncharacterized protein n=1 Tax=Bacillus coahuilensis p1.1.43 TaxID=1150625 RepID=A0A147KBA0_9BACI|nr:hypothetical protein Q75_02945 [Bacillus coahuilensis p1.1.43]
MFLSTSFLWFFTKDYVSDRILYNITIIFFYIFALYLIIDSLFNAPKFLDYSMLVVICLWFIGGLIKANFNKKNTK